MASACQLNVRWPNGVHAPSVDENEVFKAIDERMAYLKKQTKAKRIIMCLSASDNWRKIVLPTYKSNRDPKARPIALAAARQYIIDNYETIIVPTLEADDVLGIYATDPDFLPEYTKVIVTIDKDLKQIPAHHYNPDKDFEPWLQDATEGDKVFFKQWLAGDMTDGYSGCGGIGLGTAEDMYNAECFLWEQYDHEFKSGVRKGTVEKRWRKTGNTDRIEQIKSCYAKAGQTLAECEQNGYVARILRHGEFDFKTNQVTFNPFKVQL